MTIGPNSYPTQTEVIDWGRIHAGRVIARLALKKDLPFFVRDAQTGEVADIIIEQAAPNFENMLRRTYNMYNFQGQVQHTGDEVEK